MRTICVINSFDDNRFQSISDFKWCIENGGEIEFEWKNKRYAAFGRVRKDENSQIQKCICESHYIKDQKRYNTLSHTLVEPKSELWCDTADQILEYMIEGDRLRDIITQVKVTDRTI